ncbi:FliM/FliN family flagellar motor switch protein [Temperatibacter marinus]|uniref:FliM/FliN family flagellar motor switch protein n=1 Tax=Temperatibacter marinus TaxID=1456591 RepID=A0AA52EGL4_9PROT|nr:FliM/FliN family flagellar motor switch protein [Temperatibacter marinus]WND02763.1 FliM/FliN family flagellar motor switch protein [Temperatibacter marinus]
MATQAVNRVTVEITVTLGKSIMPVRQLLKMGRGAVIDLDARHEDECWIYANEELIARGEIMIVGDRVGVSITRMMSQLQV